jgi:hypothetical protein
MIPDDEEDTEDFEFHNATTSPEGLSTRGGRQEENR